MPHYIDFCFRYFRGGVFVEWMEAPRDQLLGADLVYSLGGPWGPYSAGLADNVYAADKTLEAAEAIGWIRKLRWEPGHSARAFIGLERRRMVKGSPAYSYPHEHAWAAKKDAAKAARARLEAIRIANILDLVS